ncbi:MAG TPA: biotin synthase BioB [Thermoguttaceae bacterium]|nr:biotin synthase BioB [Thermoguttaceae bacterium]
MTAPPTLLSTSSSAGCWHDLADRVLDGHALDAAEGLSILQADDVELLDLLAAGYRVRHRWCGNRMHLNFLVNARSGACGEDCGYCSQSRTSRAEITRHAMLSPDDLLAGAAQAAEFGAKTYCIVTSGRAPLEADLAAIEQVVPRIKAAHSLKVCVSPGLLTEDQAARLKQCGVDRVNHNLNTSERFYPKICTTHAYQQRLDTLAAVRRAGLEICSGGIVGLGESPEDVVELALRLGRLKVEALPVNFLIRIPGIRLEHVDCLTPRYCLKALVLFRMANPPCELRIAGGREQNLRGLQPLGLFVANSIFLGDYLTTKGQPPSADYEMIEALGFEPVLDGAR